MKKPFYKKWWVWVIALILLGSCFGGGTDEAASETEVPTIETIRPTVVLPTPTTKLTETPEPAETPEPTKTPEPVETPEPTESPIPTERPEPTVWIPTNGGSKYHSSQFCSKMKNPVQVTLSEAEARGFTACKRCYG